MAEKFEDLNLPISVVSRIAKESLPDNAGIAKEARTALARAAAVFILYVTSASNGIATKNGRKTINGNDVLQAMGETEFNVFLDPLQDSLESFKRFQKEKKDAAAKRKTDKDGVKGNGVHSEEEMNEENGFDVEDE